MIKKILFSLTWFISATTTATIPLYRTTAVLCPLILSHFLFAVVLFPALDLLVLKNEKITLEKIETNNPIVFLKKTKRSKLNFFQLKEENDKLTLDLFTIATIRLFAFNTYVQAYHLQESLQDYPWYEMHNLAVAPYLGSNINTDNTNTPVNYLPRLLNGINEELNVVNRTSANGGTIDGKLVNGLPKLIGKKLFELNCNVCHKNKKNLILPEKNLEEDTLEANGMNNLNALIYQITNGKNGMPAFGNRLKKDEIESIAIYVLENSHQISSTDLLK